MIFFCARKHSFIDCELKLIHSAITINSAIFVRNTNVYSTYLNNNYFLNIFRLFVYFLISFWLTSFTNQHSSNWSYYRPISRFFFRFRYSLLVIVPLPFFKIVFNKIIKLLIKVIKNYYNLI